MSPIGSLSLENPNRYGINKAGTEIVQSFLNP